MNRSSPGAGQFVSPDDFKASDTARPKWAPAVGIAVAVFGLLTVGSGGSVLFLGDAAREFAGDVVGFVVWFNFLAGFLYMLAGYGLIRWRTWVLPLSAVIAGSTVLVFAGFGIHAYSGGAYEPRTIVALIFRGAVWIGVFLACRTSRTA